MLLKFFSAVVNPDSSEIPAFEEERKMKATFATNSTTAADMGTSGSGSLLSSN